MGKYIHLLVIKRGDSYKNVRILTEKRKFLNQDYLKVRNIYPQYAVISIVFLGKHDGDIEKQNLNEHFSYLGEFYRIVPNKGNNCNDCDFRVNGDCTVKTIRDKSTGFCTNKNFVKETDIVIQ
jgi:hypothetical protein